MKLIEINWHPTDRQLRQFGAICLIALPAIGWIWGGGPALITILGVAGLLLAITGVVSPAVLKPVFLLLTIVTAPIGIVIGEMAMVMIYFGAILPLGLASRIAKRDPLQRAFDFEKDSYWETKKKPASIASYYRQS